MQVLEPLAIEHIALASGHVLDVPRVDQADLEAMLLKDVEERNPVDPGRLHGDGLDAALFEPSGEPLEVDGECAETANGFGVAVGGNGDVDFRGADIDAGRVVTDLHRGDLTGGLFAIAFAHSGLLQLR